MSGAAYIGLLGNYRMRTEGHDAGVVDDRFVGDGSQIGTDQIPRGPYRCFRINVHVASEFGPKTTQQKRPPAVEWPRRGAEQYRIHESPSGSLEPISHRKGRNQIGVRITGWHGCELQTVGCLIEVAGPISNYATRDISVAVSGEYRRAFDRQIRNRSQSLTALFSCNPDRVLRPLVRTVCVAAKNIFNQMPLSVGE